MHTLTVAAASAVLAAGTLVAGTLPAHAASGTAYAAQGGAYTSFNDTNDNVRVCDTRDEGYGAVGWISVLQRDGSWAKKAELNVTGGSGTCRTVRQDVKMERMAVAVVSCHRDVRGGITYVFGCQTKRLQG